MAVDLLGQVFGELVVLSYSHSENKRQYWNCQCSCGNFCVKNTWALRAHDVKSCGHLKRRTGSNSKTWKGYEEISKSHWNQILRSAELRNLEFCVNIEYVWKLYIEQNRKCALSDIDINFGSYKTTPVTASLDRIDSSLGYIEGNLQWVHKDINRMKHNFSEDYFTYLAECIVLKNERINNG